MNTFRTIAAAKALGLALMAGPAIAAAAAAPATPQPPAGDYAMDKAHTSLTFRVSHLGFSHYTARFARVDGRLKFDPTRPAAMTVQASIDPKSLALNTPPPGFYQQLMSKPWFDAAQFPKMAFRSTSVQPTGRNTARVTGDLTLRGVTKPVVLEVTYNGGWQANAMDGARIGFSAHGTLKRSAFGMTSGLPAPGTSLGVGDDVDIAIETEFSSGKPTGASAEPAKK